MNWELYLVIGVLLFLIVYGASKGSAFFNAVGWIVFFPISYVFKVLLFPIEYYNFVRGFDQRLYYLMTFGRQLIGGYHGKIKIGTKKGNIIYVSDNFDINGNVLKWKDNYDKNITTLLKMRVYSYWVEDDYLFVKVFNNSKLIERFKSEYR